MGKVKSIHEDKSPIFAMKLITWVLQDEWMPLVHTKIFPAISGQKSIHILFGSIFPEWQPNKGTGEEQNEGFLRLQGSS